MTVKCYWLCRDKQWEKDADIWLYDPIAADLGPIPLCHECHEIRDKHKRLRYEPILKN